MCGISCLEPRPSDFLGVLRACGSYFSDLGDVSLRFIFPFLLYMYNTFLHIRVSFRCHEYFVMSMFVLWQVPKTGIPVQIEKKKTIEKKKQVGIKTK